MAGRELYEGTIKLHKKSSVLSIVQQPKVRDEEIVVKNGKDASFLTHRFAFLRLHEENDLTDAQNVLEDLSPMADPSFLQCNKENKPTLRQFSKTVQEFVLKNYNKITGDRRKCFKVVEITAPKMRSAGISSVPYVHVDIPPNHLHGIFKQSKIYDKENRNKKDIEEHLNSEKRILSFWFILNENYIESDLLIGGRTTTEFIKDFWKYIDNNFIMYKKCKIRGIYVNGSMNEIPDYMEWFGLEKMKFGDCMIWDSDLVPHCSVRRIAQKKGGNEIEYLETTEKRRSLEIRLVCHLRHENFKEDADDSSSAGKQQALYSHKKVVPNFINSLIKGTDMTQFYDREPDLTYEK